MSDPWCEECFHAGGQHSDLCSLNTRLYMHPLREWVAMARKSEARAMDRARLFEGKLAILRHENNKLRRKYHRALEMLAEAEGEPADQRGE